MGALAEQLAKLDNCQFDLITNAPNRYQLHSTKVNNKTASYQNLNVYKVAQKPHSGSMLAQTILFFRYSCFTFKFLLKNKAKYDLVYATSSRLFTAILGCFCSILLRTKLYLDIRDLFVDTISEVIGGIKGKLMFLGLYPLQYLCFRRASHINLNSKGFENYIKSRFSKTKLSFYTNGIDEIFYGIDWNKRSKQQKINIYYAGNIGAGQGLELFVPKLAKQFKDRVNFILIGSGTTLPQLRQQITNLDNVELREPTTRELMLKQLQDADVLFLSLNNFYSLQKVLPSKLFEYAAIPKPIYGGLTGYSKQFASEITDSYIFDSSNANEAIQQMELLLANTFKKEVAERYEFMQKYRRSNIMQAMAQSIIDLCD